MAENNFNINNPVVVEVVDAPMSTGKTTGIIQWMKEHPNEKYLYVSPMLSEVEERIPQQASDLDFHYPISDNCTKSESLLSLLEQGVNISFTHSLFQSLSKKHLDLIKQKEYILIIDEEVGLIESYSGRYTKGDISFLLDSKSISIDYEHFGEINWIGGDIDLSAAYSNFKRMCDASSLYITKGARDMLISQLPIQLVISSKRTIILTYMFEGSVMESFLKLRGVTIKPFEEVKLIKCPNQVVRDAKNLITIKTTPSIDKIERYNLSSVWWSRTANKEQLKEVTAAIRSVYRKQDTDVKKMLLTIPKDNSEKMIGSRRNPRFVLPRGVNADDVFLYSAARATNNYSDRDLLIHGYNRFINVPVKTYFNDYGEGIHPKEDVFALSEMVQWIWRSAIRNDKPITLYILNKRMRELLKNWLNNNM